MTGQEIPEAVVEKAARALQATGGGFFSPEAWQVLARPAAVLVWAAAREQALAEAEEALRTSPAVLLGGPGGGYEILAALRRKEGGDA